MDNNRSHTAYWAAVSSPSAAVSAGEIVVVATGAHAAAATKDEPDGPGRSISSPNQPPWGGCDEQNVYNLLSQNLGQKYFVDELWTGLGDP